MEAAATPPVVLVPAAGAATQAAPGPVARSPAPPPPAPAGGFSNLFRRVTGGSVGLMRRQVPEATTPAPRLEPVAVSSVPPDRAPLAPAVRPVPQDEVGLEIPTFLRRQSN
jgi:hypothetical protein